MASKARDLSNFISTAAIDASEIATGAITTDKIADTTITHAKLHTTMDLSGKTVTLPTINALDVTNNINVGGTVDGVDIQTLNTTAGDALPKAGGTMTGALTVNAAAVFNETSADVDFRVESNTKTHALEVNGASGVVGIGCHETVDNLNLNFYGEGTNSTCIIHGDNDGGDVMIAMANSSNHNSSDESLSLHLQPASLGKGVLLRAHREGNFDSAANSSASFELIVNKANTAISALKVDTSGNVNINAGDLFFGTAGKGIVLGATTNVDANTLDDYEEGTWTPTAVGGLSGLTKTDCFYRKIGSLVHIAGRVSGFTGIDSSTLQFGGLPFNPTHSSSSGTVSTTFVDLDQGYQLWMYLAHDEPKIYLRYQMNNAQYNSLAGSDISSSSNIYFNATYIVD